MAQTDEAQTGKAQTDKAQTGDSRSHRASSPERGPEHAPDDARRSWRKTLKVTAWLALLWVSVSVGVPWFAPRLQGQVGGFPLGYWLAAQGALLVFLAIVVGYALWMEAIEDAPRAAVPPGDLPAHGER